MRKPERKKTICNAADDDVGVEMGKRRQRNAFFYTVRTRAKKALRAPDAKPALRRYLVNTVFDSTFVILGVVIGLAFAPDPDFRILVGTILTSSVALAISTGVSIYEGESLEQEKRIKKIEMAVLRELGDTEIDRRSSASAALIAFANFLAPLLVCGAVLMPFLILGENGIHSARYVAVGLALGVLFLTGAILGKMGGRNPWVRGSRMAAIGFAAFIICYSIEMLI